MARITLANSSQYDGQYVGKPVIHADGWSPGHLPYASFNVENNAFLAAYKYFLGDSAGENLWALIDYAYAHASIEKTFGWTIVNRGSNFTDSKNRSGCTLYDLTSGSAHVLWYDSPDGQDGLDIVILSR